MLNIEGKVFFVITASKLTQYIVQPIHRHNNPERGSTRLTGVHKTHLHDLGSNSTGEEEPKRLSLYAVWLDLMNAYGSVPHQLFWKMMENHDQDILRVFQRVRDDVFQDGLHNKMD